MECEQVFFNRPVVVAEDAEHSRQEERLFALGQTDAGRLLFVVFTIRRDLIRVISARSRPGWPKWRRAVATASSR